jgi:hypothetical protein
MARPAGRGLPHERARLAVAGSRLYSLAPGPVTARQTSPRRRLGILLGASAIGLGYGWIARIGTGARVGSDVVIARGARVAPDAVVRDLAVVRRRAGSGGSEYGIAA